MKRTSRVLPTNLKFYFRFSVLMLIPLDMFPRSGWEWSQHWWSRRMLHSQLEEQHSLPRPRSCHTTSTSPLRETSWEHPAERTESSLSPGILKTISDFLLMNLVSCTHVGNVDTTIFIKDHILLIKYFTFVVTLDSMLANSWYPWWRFFLQNNLILHWKAWDEKDNVLWKYYYQNEKWIFLSVPQLIQRHIKDNQNLENSSKNFVTNKHVPWCCSHLK